MPASFTIDVQGSTAVARMLGAYPDKTTRATVRALNRAIASARTVMVREIALDTNLKSKDVRDALPMREARPSNLSATLAASLKRISLIKFGARGPEPSRGKGRGVTYRMGGSRGRVPNAFIETMRSGHRGVFARVGKGRLPIRELKGPSLGHVFEKYRAAGQAKALEAFDKNFDHEMAFAAGGGATTDAG